MSRRIAVVGSPARLRLEHRQLMIDQGAGSCAQIPAEDLGVLLIEDPRVTITVAALNGLMTAGTAVVICGVDHLPSGMLLPVAGHHWIAERQLAQRDLPKPLGKRMWQALVRAKIQQQGAVLRRLGGSGEGLAELARRVRSGDPDNLEAQAARRYWPALLGSAFRREPGGEPPNNLLNYGYAVVRAAAARHLAASGLATALGLFHHNRANPFCLADDLIEPFRPLVDLAVARHHAATPVDRDLDRAAKSAALAVLVARVPIEGRLLPTIAAIERSAQTLAVSVVERQHRMILPEGLPPPGDDATADADDDRGTP